MRAPFADANPGVIDAQSLAAEAQMTSFSGIRCWTAFAPTRVPTL